MSPIYGDLNGLKRVVLFVGTREILYPDIIRFDQLLDRADVEHTLIAGRDMGHVFPACPIQEAHQAREIACHMITQP